ncbi:leucyl aminopeptidase [bacterium]|nr:leucyl aminopeptidase [bacterium]
MAKSVVGISEGLMTRIDQLRQQGDFEGKRGEQIALYDSFGTPFERILLVGLGKADTATLGSILRAGGAAIRTISKRGANIVAFASVPAGSSLDPSQAAAAQVTGAILGEGSQEIFRSNKSRKPIGKIIVSSPDADAIDRSARIAESVRWAADLVNLTPEELYPESFCQRAIEESATLPIKVEVLRVPELSANKMACILGVGRGSVNEPRLLILRYQAAPSDPRQLALVGKGITFDSGGLSIKTADGMLTMKCDMAGAAAVVAATMAIARLKLPVNILCVAPLAENMPSSNAIRPGDVLRAKNGKTIEVVNTDAEGRLVLADALSHAIDLGATHLVDLATLTGACLVALGTSVAGLMTNQEDWADQVHAASESVGERLWRLPLDDDYEELIRSGIADMKNSGGKYGGAITAAKLLEQFVANKPWCHLDIAGPAFSEKESPHQDAGGTGFGVRTLVELADRFARR